MTLRIKTAGTTVRHHSENHNLYNYCLNNLVNILSRNIISTINLRFYDSRSFLLNKYQAAIFFVWNSKESFRDKLKVTTLYKYKRLPWFYHSEILLTFFHFGNVYQKHLSKTYYKNSDRITINFISIFRIFRDSYCCSPYGV